MRESLIEILQKEVKNLQKSLIVLDHSYKICANTGFTNDYSIEELDAFESLTARFARTSDILTQKLLRTIEEIDLDFTNSIRDRINQAEKKGIISRADDLINIRQLRNQIAHNYTDEEIYDIFKEVLRNTPLLIDLTKNAIVYAQKYIQEK